MRFQENSSYHIAKMEGEERPQKMRKLSRDHEESQAESVATKNDSNAPENEDAAQPVTEENKLLRKPPTQKLPLRLRSSLQLQQLRTAKIHPCRKTSSRSFARSKNGKQDARSAK